MNKIKWNKKDLYSLDIPMSKVIASGVRAFRKQGLHSYPSDLTFKEWKKILKKIEKGFDLYYVDDKVTWGSEENQKLFQEALELFCKYYQNLWD